MSRRLSFERNEPIVCCRCVLPPQQPHLHPHPHSLRPARRICTCPPPTTPSARPTASPASEQHGSNELFARVCVCVCVCVVYGDTPTGGTLKGLLPLTTPFLVPSTPLPLVPSSPRPTSPPPHIPPPGSTRPQAPARTPSCLSSSPSSWAYWGRTVRGGMLYIPAQTEGGRRGGLVPGPNGGEERRGVNAEIKAPREGSSGGT